jgi:hypothetical protein
MSDSLESEQNLGRFSHEEMMSALFAQLVIQQSNMAMLLLGKMPNPQTGEKMRDLEAAKLFIDQLEMLEVKTKGNLSKEEELLLKQSLMSLRMAFVEAVESPAETAQKPDSAPAIEEKKAEPAAPDQAADAEAKKKFTKKY